MSGSDQGRAGADRAAGDGPEPAARGFLTTDEDRTVTHLNDPGRALLGAQNPVGDPLRTVLPDALVAPFREVLREASESDRAVTVETDRPGGNAPLEICAFPDTEGMSVVFETVADGRQASDELRASRESLRRLHELATDTDLTRAERIERMLAVGRDRLGVRLGFLTRIEDGTQTVVNAVGDHDPLAPGSETPLSRAYCRHTVESAAPLAVLDATEEGWADDPAYREFGLACYLGATVTVDGEQYGTLCFADTEPRERSFTDSERAFVDLLTDRVGHVLERRVYETEIETKRRRLETITDHVPVVLFALDPDGTFTLVRGQGLDALGFDPASAVGESIFERYADYPSLLEHFERAREGAESHHTVELGEGALDVWYRPVYDEGTLEQVVGVAQDASRRRAHRERLSGLLETTRSLMQARSRESVADITVAAAADVLGYDRTVMHLYDLEGETLDPAAETSTAATGGQRTYAVGEGLQGEVFATGEPHTVDEPGALGDDAGEIRSAICYPVGVHGTITLGSTDPGAFDDTDEQVLALLATVAAAACTRAKREREVREAREHVETVLDRINGLIENTVEVLVQATTREELETGVVDQLAATAPYTFAWLATPDVADETLVPSAWAGEAPIPAGDLSFDLGGSGPVASALADGQLRVVDDPAGVGAPPDGDDAAVETAILVPLSYTDTTYGVAAVFADEPGAFDERERAVLSALGRAVANAINAVERGRILDTDRVIELEFTAEDSALLFGRLSASAGCRIVSEGTDYRSDGTLQAYLTAEDADGRELAALAREDEAVIGADCIVDHGEECLLELVVEESLVATLADHGAVPRSVTAESGVVRFVVELPHQDRARELFGLVDERYAGTELVGYHEHERPVETRQEFRAALSERFTDRQETALRTAFLGGFFEWPRGIDGNDLAEAMDISRPTYHQHLRAAQQKVFEELFDPPRR